MRTLVILVAVAVLVNCSKSQPKSFSTAVGAKQSKPDARPADFELKVENTNGGTTVFTFRFPDQVGRIPRISSISMGKVKTGGVCAIRTRNLAGELITGFWPLGMVPKNYKLEEGCKEVTLSPGDYEIQIFTTQRGEFRNRLHVTGDGVVRVLPWEEGMMPDSLGL